MPDDFDPTLPHTLTVESRTSQTTVIIDGQTIANFAPIATGYVGLATSISAISFDELEIVSL